MQDNKVKLLLITARTDVGGGPKSVLMLSKYLSEDFDLYIACPNNPPYFDLYKQNERVKGFYFIPHRKFLLNRYFGLVLFTIKNRIQIINSNGTGAGLYSRLLKITCPWVKIVHTFRGVNTKNVGSIKSNVYFFYERLFSYLTNNFINVSHGEQNVCLEQGFFSKKKSIVIHNGIEMLYTTGILKNDFENKFVITTLSRFDYPKNMLLSYQIAQRLKNYPDIVFLWIGDGDDKAELEILARQNNLNIVFPGFKNNIADYLSVSSLYLSTSRWEGLPLGLLEAISLGIPIVASDIVGNNEVVENGINGFLFDLNNIETAVNSILKLYNDKELRKRFSIAAKSSFVNKFSAEIMANNSSAFFKKIVNS